MNKEEIKELARQSMIETIKTNLDSAMIFMYIKSLEDKIQKAIEYIEENCYDEERKMVINEIYNEIPELLDILRGNDNE